METIGLYGGTFGPPHCGHVHAAKTFLQQVSMDRLLIMPTGIPPHKVKSAGDTSALRLEMCQAAFGNLPKTEISDYEIQKDGKSYTIDTLSWLKTPKNRIVMLCGTDMFLTLSTWQRASEIFRLCTVACMARENGDETHIQDAAAFYRCTYHADVVLLHGKPYPLSSSELREKLRRGEDVTQYLPRAVWEICRRERLYRVENLANE